MPLFAEKSEDLIRSVSLVSLSGIQPYLKIAYIILVTLAVAFGILTLALQSCQAAIWAKLKLKISLLINTATVLLFIISLQSYAATVAFVLLIIKILMLIKWK